MIYLWLKKKQLKQKKNEKFRGDFILIRSNRGKTKRGEQQKKMMRRISIKVRYQRQQLQTPNSKIY